MSGPVGVVSVEPRPVAVRRGRIAWSELGETVPRWLDEVWTFVRSIGAASPSEGISPEGLGHHVVVYRDPDEESVDLEVGVQIGTLFESDGAVQCSELPAGRAARLVHVGPYSELGMAHDALQAWIHGSDEIDGGVAWEIYGHWHDDPEQRLTLVFRLLG